MQNTTIKPSFNYPRFIRTIQRQFHADVWLREIVQNAYRAGASKIKIERNTEMGIITIEDNGIGIQTQEEWNRILEAYGSGWDEDTQKINDPAGIGMFMILTKFPLEIQSGSKVFRSTPEEILEMNPRALVKGNRKTGTRISLLQNITNEKWERALYHGLQSWNRNRKGEIIQLELIYGEKNYKGPIQHNPYAYQPSTKIITKVWDKTFTRLQEFESPRIEGEGWEASTFFDGKRYDKTTQTHILCQGHLIKIELEDAQIRDFHNILVNVWGEPPFDLRLPDRNEVIQNERWDAFKKELIKLSEKVKAFLTEKEKGEVMGIPPHYSTKDAIISPACDSKDGETWSLILKNEVLEKFYNNGVWPESPFGMTKEDFLFEISQEEKHLLLIDDQGKPKKCLEDPADFDKSQDYDLELFLPPGNINLWAQQTQEKKNVFWSCYHNKKASVREPIHCNKIQPWVKEVSEKIDITDTSVYLEVREIGVIVEEETIIFEEPFIFPTFKEELHDIFHGETATVIANPAFRKLMDEDPNKASSMYEEMLKINFRWIESGENWGGVMSYTQEKYNDAWGLKEAKKFFCPPPMTQHVQGMIKTVLRQISNNACRMLNEGETPIVKRVKFSKANGFSFAATIQSKIETLKIEYNDDLPQPLKESLAQR